MTAEEIYKEGEKHYNDNATTPNFGQIKKTSSTSETQQIVVDYLDTWYLVMCDVRFGEVQTYPNSGMRLVKSITPKSFRKIV